MATSGDDGPDDGVDSRQLLLVSLCLVGLVTAAFLAPVTGSNQPVGGGGDILGDIVEGLVELLEPGDGQEPRDRDPPEGGGGGGDDGDGGDGSAPDWLRPLLELINWDGGNDGGGGEGEPTDCQVYVENQPAPGSETTVVIVDEEEPQEGVRVWFNGEYVGETDAEGSVTGEVPYVDRLNVTVGYSEPCTFTNQPSVADVGAGVTDLGATASVAGPLHSVAADTAGLGTAPASQVGQSDDSVNSSGEVEVEGDATIELVGEPYPNATVTLVVTAGGVPVPEANVSVDGKRVGQTDDTGRYSLAIPDRNRVRVTASRGSVSGQRRIDIRQLRLRFAPQLTIPGETVTATARTNGEPVPGATVSLDGRRVDTTDDNGTATLVAPATLSGTVTVSTARQTTTVPVTAMYRLTAGLAAVLLVFATVSTGATARRHGRETATRLATVWVAVAALFVAYTVFELVGLVVWVLGVALVWLVRNRARVLSGGLSAASLLASLVASCHRMALALVGWLEGLLDLSRATASGLLGWLRSLPRSLTALAGRLGAWLRAVPGRLRGVLSGLSARSVAVVVFALAFVAVATYQFGVLGLVGSVLLLVAALVVWLLVRVLASSSEAATDSSEQTLGDVLSAPTSEGDTDRSLRELWRRMARWVLPENWRTRTPTEVSEAAIDYGLPREPVERLTEAFQDVEYGGHTPSSRMEEAWQAYEALETAREEEEL